MPQRANRRGPKQRAVARQRKASKSPLPALVYEGTMAWDVAQALKKGKTVKDVAAEFGITETRIGIVMKDALRALHESIATILQNWTTVSLAREEEILAKLWPRMFNEDGVPDGEIIGMVQDVILMEQKLLSFTAAANKEGKSPTMVQNVTFVGGSPLYEEAMHALNANMRTEAGEQRDADVLALDDVVVGGIAYEVKK